MYVSCTSSSANHNATSLSKGHFNVTIFMQKSNSTYINLKGFFGQLACLLAFFLSLCLIIDPRAQEAAHSKENTNTGILLSTWYVIDCMLLHSGSTVGQGIWLALYNQGMCWLLGCHYQSYNMFLQLLIKAFFFLCM